jgi:hypothetical protein
MRILSLIFLLLTVFACHNDETLSVCNSEDPVNHLPWLKRTITDIQSDPNYVSVVISVFDYKGQTVFNIYDMISSCAFCDLRDCSGQKYSPPDFNDLIANKKNERRIWCQNSALCMD